MGVWNPSGGSPQDAPRDFFPRGFGPDCQCTVVSADKQCNVKESDSPWGRIPAPPHRASGDSLRDDGRREETTIASESQSGGPLRVEPSPLRVGIDGTCLGTARGYGRFLRELLPPLARQAGDRTLTLFLDRTTAAGADLAFTGALEGLRVETIETGAGQAAAASASGNRGVGDLWRMGRAVARFDLDVFYFPSVYSWFPIPRRLPIAVAIHDTIPERHGRMVFPHWRNRLLWNAKSALARRQATSLITVSEYARRQLAEWFGLEAARIHVTPEAPAPSFEAADDPALREKWLAEQGLASDAPYFVYVGGLNPHKNLPALVRAFAAADDRGAAHLLIVGSYDRDVFHGERAVIQAEIERSGVASRVHWTGFVPDETLRHVYAGARAAVLPAFEEGFGLPAVEAAACGTPCIATRESPLPEVLAGGGIFIDPHDSVALERALAAWLDDPGARAAFARGAREAVARLSWDTTADATWTALEATAAARGSRR